MQCIQPGNPSVHAKDHPSVATCVRGGSRWSIRAVTGLLLGLAGNLAVAQSGDSYWVNQGLSGGHDTTLGEFAIDVGGNIPFENYDDSNHYLAPMWTCTSTSPRSQILDKVHNLVALEVGLQACNGGVPMFLHKLDPTDPATVVTADAAHTGQTTTFWNATVQVSSFRVNGGYVQAIYDINNVNSPPHILLVNSPGHPSHFSTAGFFPLDEILATPYGWSATTNGLPVDQAIKAGDMVVIVHEGVSSDLWNALQRTQEAQYFIRHHHLKTELGLTPAQIDDAKSFLYGGSWGGQVSQWFSMLQPDTYHGAAGAFASDMGIFIIGDWFKFAGHVQSGLGNGAFPQIFSNEPLKNMFLPIDLLGIRFDNPEPGLEGWDYAAFSLTHRRDDDPNILQVPIYGNIGSEDLIFNYHWDVQNLVDSNFRVNYLKNVAHDGDHGMEDGKNEFFFTDNNEWSTLVSAGTSGNKVDLAPISSAPGYDPYPDPYTHLLRREDTGPAIPWDNFLQQIDLAPDSPLKSIGQGTQIGAGGGHGVEDLDGDGRLEVYFGNFEGFFHVLELRDFATDNPILVDEYKSPYLGWGLFSMDRGKSGTIFLGDSQGRIHRVRATGPDSYQVNPALRHQDYSDVLYDGPVVLLYRGNFHPGEKGEETLVLNQFLDWVLISQSGKVLQKLERDTEALGPGECVVVDHLSPLPVNNTDELVIPALDGHVWVLRWDGSQLVKEELIAQSEFAFPLAFYKVKYLNEDELLLFGKNDSVSPSDRTIKYSFASESLRMGNPTPVIEGEFQDFEPPDISAGDNFGTAVDLDCDLVVVGAPGDSSSVGSAYVLRLADSDNWEQEAKFTPIDQVGDDAFGSAVSISGNTVAIGAPGRLGGTGKVYIYRYNPLTQNWFEEDKFAEPSIALGDRFGASVSLNGDVLAVGSPGDTDFGSESGSVSIFRRSGGSWSFSQKITSFGAAPGDNFGSALKLRDNFLLIGAPGKDVLGTDDGAAFVYNGTTGTFLFHSALIAPDTVGGEMFGSSVAADSGRLLIGSPMNSEFGPGSGAAYVYEWNGTWTPVAKLGHFGAIGFESFGTSVALSRNVAVIGAANSDLAGEIGSGSAHWFRRNPLDGMWSEEFQYTASNALGDDGYGAAVAVSGEVAVIGAGDHDGAGSNSGAIYVVGADPAISTPIEFTRNLKVVVDAENDLFYAAAGNVVGRFDLNTLERLEEFDVLEESQIPGTAAALAACNRSLDNNIASSYQNSPLVQEPGLDAVKTSITSLSLVSTGGGSLSRSGPEGGGAGQLSAATNDGRIFLFKPRTLEPARLSDQIFDIPAGENAEPWPSNETFAHVQAADVYQDGPKANLYLAEFNYPVSREDPSSGDSRNRTWRVAELNVGRAATLDTPRLDPFVFEGHQRAERAITGEATLTRSFTYQDLDGNGTPEAYFLGETGALINDNGTIRRFCTRSTDRSIMEVVPQWAMGGYLFEFFPEADEDDPQKDYSVLTGFHVPKTDSNLYERPGSNGVDWFHAKVGSNRYTGQIATPQQSANKLYAGTSLISIDLPDPNDNDTVKPHLVTGTLGGYVYGVVPGSQQSGSANANNSTPSTLSYHSLDLGWFAIGMDAGELPGTSDGLPRIVVGTMMDTGSFDDWAAGSTTKNRGKVTILRPDPAKGEFVIEDEWNADELVGTRHGTSAVAGIKIDDVNGDGVNEVWAGDAAGFLYLFEYDAVLDEWNAVYRSECLGAYPGYFNNIFPIKGPKGQTVKLAVLSSGYVMAFDVDWERVGANDGSESRPRADLPRPNLR